MAVDSRDRILHVLKTKKLCVILPAAIAVIFIIIRAGLLPGTMENKAVSVPKTDHLLMECEPSSKSDEAGINEQNQFKDSPFWDSLFSVYRDSPFYFDQYEYLEEKMGDNAEQLLPEGLVNRNPTVRWYCAYKILEYVTAENRGKIISKLKSVTYDSKEYVRSAAIFGLAALEGTFEGQGFIKSASGKRAALVRYSEARYNDGEILMLEEGKLSIVYKGLNAAPIAWSPDEKQLAVEAATRITVDTYIVDVETGKVNETGVFEYITKHAARYGFEIGKNQRPDPYIRWMEWSPDSKKVLLSYSFTDDLYTRQTGVAVFDLDKKAVDWMLKLLPAEGEHALINKPEFFRWDSTDYGWETGLTSLDIENGDGVFRYK